MSEKRMAPGKTDTPFDLRDRTFLFSVRVIKWIRLLPNDTGTQVVVRQLCKSSMSIGANVEETDGADTPKDRVYKWVLARKEARESRFWIRLLCAIGSDSPEGQALVQEAHELVNILSALITKGKRNLGAT